MSDTPDCPLCMETFEIDDLHFYPCTCGYQICRFCWHRIRTDGNGLCPACRKTYSEDPAMYRPLSQDEIQKVKKERKQKDVQYRQKISANRQHLSNIRVIQRHLVFVVGLSNKMADADILRRPEYFGKYGKIVKIVINPNTNYAGPQGPSASAYITYTREQDALKAILSINNTQPPLKIRASLGTTKYCTHYLRNQTCPKTDCMYLHDVGDEDASFTKEDMQAGKHQLFEKNLLDDYVTAVEQSRRLQKSVSETSESDQLDSHPHEDWNEEEDDNNADSLLPSQASWGSSNLSSMKSISHELEYPELESKATEPLKTVVLAQQHNNTTAQSMTEATTSVAVKVAKKSLETPAKTEVPADEKNLLPAGWTVGSDNVHQRRDPLLVDATNSYSWPTISDLGLTDLKISSDDDLGFDPFNECKSALEDLVENEKKVGVAPSVQPAPSFSWDSFWPSDYSSNQTRMPLLGSYSLFGAQQQMTQPQMIQYRQPINPYQVSMQSNQMHATAPNSSASFRFMSPTQSMQRFPQQQKQLPAAAPQVISSPQAYSPVQNPLFGSQQQQNAFQNSPFANQFSFNAPNAQSRQPQQALGLLQHLPTTAVSVTLSTSLSTTSAVSCSSSSVNSDKNWQDGLRALLPNINISFSNQGVFAGDETVYITESGSITTPPPGFVGFNVAPKTTPQDKAARAPPGFSKPVAEVFSPSAAIFNVSSGLPAMVPSSYVSTTTNSVISKPSHQPINASSAHDDPSILWSKVLSDKPKELEATEIAFPLPGETVKGNHSTQSQSNVLPPPQQQSLNLTSWNAVVSGSQHPKLGQQHNSLDDTTTVRNSQQPLIISAREASSSVNIHKPQKPSPIFGNQQKQAIKKPTAHVKPLKCNLDDGFTTVQNSRQPGLNTLTNPGSRVSELDDFTTDLIIPTAIMEALAGNDGDFPVVSHVGSTSSKTNKKRKKKTKEQAEHVSEIIVGRVEVERPVVILDDERPKKGKSNKKKSLTKISSPPQYRKSPVLIRKDQSAPTIRILKTDGNHGGVTTPPVQVVAGGDLSKTGLPDHEIVSRLTESTEKLLKNVLFETEAIKSNTEQISKDLKSALEKCKESSLSLSDLEKINLLLTPGKLAANELDDSDLVDTTDLERQVESARREAKMLEARLNDVIRKNMASELETLKRNTKSSENQES